VKPANPSHCVEEEVRPGSNPASSTRLFLTGYETAHKFPTAFLLVSGCVKCQSSPATVSRPSGRNRESLAELSSAYYAFGLFGKNPVDVEVETCEAVIQQDQ
jgi:hypothetical protein